MVESVPLLNLNIEREVRGSFVGIASTTEEVKAIAKSEAKRWRREICILFEVWWYFVCRKVVYVDYGRFSRSIVYN